MPLKYGEALRDITLDQLLNAIKSEKDFAWMPCAIKCVESENNVKFDIYASKDTSNKKMKEWQYVETLTASDKYEARRLRRYKRYPEHNYGVLVNFVENENRVVRVHYLWDDKNDKIANLSMRMKVVEDFLAFKGFETSEEVTEFVKKKEEDADREYMNEMRAMQLKMMYERKSQVGGFNPWEGKLAPTPKQETEEIEEMEGDTIDQEQTDE